ncbi:hypothetical protein MRX96_028136 [Rhipicephalus microplus]
MMARRIDERGKIAASANARHPRGSSMENVETRAPTFCQREQSILHRRVAGGSVCVCSLSRRFAATGTYTLGSEQRIHAQTRVWCRGRRRGRATRWLPHRVRKSCAAGEAHRGAGVRIRDNPRFPAAQDKHEEGRRLRAPRSRLHLIHQRRWSPREAMGLEPGFPRLGRCAVAPGASADRGGMDSRALLAAFRVAERILSG